jgi:hypothetical protein
VSLAEWRVPKPTNAVMLAFNSASLTPAASAVSGASAASTGDVPASKAATTAIDRIVTIALPLFVCRPAAMARGWHFGKTCACIPRPKAASRENEKGRPPLGIGQLSISA